MVGVDTVFSFDHPQTTLYRPKKWCDQKKKRWEFTPPCLPINVLVPAPTQKM
jgi:hypothetical protein